VLHVGTGRRSASSRSAPGLDGCRARDGLTIDRRPLRTRGLCKDGTELLNTKKILGRSTLSPAAPRGPAAGRPASARGAEEPAVPFPRLARRVVRRSDPRRTKALRAGNHTLHDLEQRRLIFFTGCSRDADQVLGEQKQRSDQGDRAMLENLHVVKELGLFIKVARAATPSGSRSSCTSTDSTRPGAPPRCRTTASIAGPRSPGPTAPSAAS
jgi:hypothetical protein